jgi:hypothetical protein
VLDLELSLHAECGALLDCKRFALECLNSARRPQVDDDVFTTFDFETEREDDAFAGVAGVGDVLALTEAEGGFPLLEGLVVLVYDGEVRRERLHILNRTYPASGIRQWSSSRQP